MRYLLLLLVCLAGCAEGKLVDQSRASCVVIRQSGAMIMDVWITVEVRSRSWHSGFKFEDQAGNPIAVGNDCKVIHVKDSEDLNLYHEYHAELEFHSYRYKYNVPRRQPPMQGWLQPLQPLQPLSEINRRPPVCNEFSAISSAWMTNTP